MNDRSRSHRLAARVHAGGGERGDGAFAARERGAARATREARTQYGRGARFLLVIQYTMSVHEEASLTVYNLYYLHVHSTRC